MPAQCTTKPLEYEGHDRLPWSGIPPGARASRPHLIPANSLPTTATLLQSAPSPPLRGSLRSCQVLCGRDARAPGWSFSARVWASARLMAVQTIKTTCSLGVESVPALEELARHWEVSKSEVLRRTPVCVWKDIHPGARASRPHPYSRKQPANHGHSFAKCTKPATTGISSIVPGFVRAGRPRSRVVFFGKSLGIG